jgi:hypothetical protein
MDPFQWGDDRKYQQDVLVINACLLRGFSIQVLAGLINRQLKPVYYALIKFSDL